MNHSLSHPLAQPHRKPSFLQLILRLSALSRQRQTLAQLDADHLRDIGLTPDQARTEAARPVWDVPKTWRM